MQNWLKEEKDRGQPLPNSQGEMMNRFRNSRKINFKDKLKNKSSMQYSPQDRRRLEKWGINGVAAHKGRIDYSNM